MVISMGFFSSHENEEYESWHGDSVWYGIEGVMSIVFGCLGTLIHTNGLTVLLTGSRDAGNVSDAYLNIFRLR